MRWATAGFLFGLIFPLASWIIAVTNDDVGSIWEAHRAQPVLWVTDLAPFALAAVGFLIGLAHTHFAALQRQTQELAERVAKEWSAEMHDSNVELARTASLQAKYFATLSHDMRTPLSAIMGFASLVEEDPEADTQVLSNYMKEIGTCASQLLEIVNDLLDAAKMEAGRIELNLADIDGDEVASQVLRHLQPLADESGLQLLVELGADQTVRADPQRLRQILINLTANALKYTDTGLVSVRSHNTSDHVVFEVRDTGHGISMDDMPKIFTPFEQTDVASRRTDSTGLGLPISLGLARAMGGTIQVESDGPGRGSTFRLLLRHGTGMPEELSVAELPAMVG